jgi:phage regulator Rha-like protein
MSNTKKENQLVPAEIIERHIFLIRGHKVMLDSDLAELYEVPTKRLKEQVRRNRRRFPTDFMFELSNEEFEFLRSHFATSKVGRGGTRYKPFAFTEQGVSMLSSILTSDRAIDVNIAIVRTFVRLREIFATHKELAGKLDELEKKYDKQFAIVFDAIRQLMTPPEKPKKQIGFKVSEPKVQYKATKKR